MKAALIRRYGPAETVTVEQIPRPEPGPGEVLVAVQAGAVTTANWRIRAAAFPGILAIPGRLMIGITRPRRPVQGNDFAGRIAAVGDGVDSFKPGDAVYGFAPDGAHAEYLTMKADGAIALRPLSLDPAQAAALPFGALSALVFLRDFARVMPGQRVLVIGASGGVGVFAVQIARQMGASVTGVASAANADLVRSLGAAEVIDYTKGEIAQAGSGYDLILDTVGAVRFGDIRDMLLPRGVFLPLEFGVREIGQSLLTRLTGGPRVVIGVSGDSSNDLRQIAEMADAGTLVPVIDSRYPLDRIADAHRRAESRHKTGAVVLDIADPNSAEDAV